MRQARATLGVLGTVVAIAASAPAQAVTMDDVRTALKAEKKALVAENMGLSKAQEEQFWPVYDSYQAELGGLNDRLAKLIRSYAEDYTADTLTDQKAKQLMTEALDIEDAEVKLKRAYAKKMEKVLPPKQVARWLQIETKIRSVLKFDLADGIPLVD